MQQPAATSVLSVWCLRRGGGRDIRTMSAAGRTYDPCGVAGNPRGGVRGGGNALVMLKCTRVA